MNYSRSYTVVLDWMHDLGLKPQETLCYATIFGFCQDGDGRFNGSRSYLSRKMGVTSKRTVDAALQSLCDRNLITKQETVYNGVKYCTYSIVWESVPGSLEGASDSVQSQLAAPVARAPKVDVDAMSRELCPGFTSPEWHAAVADLAEAKKWKKKTELAWKMSFTKLAAKPEPVAVEMVRRCIAGEWQGLVELKPYEVAEIMGTAQAPSYGPARPAAGAPRRGGVSASEEIFQAAMAEFNR